MTTSSENTRHKVASARIDLRHLALIPLVFLLIGCGRCQECSYPSGGAETICETEFDSPAQYDLAIDAAEAGGASCVAKGGF
jgi:hypothetical protein